MHGVPCHCKYTLSGCTQSSDSVHCFQGNELLLGNTVYTSTSLPVAQVSCCGCGLSVEVHVSHSITNQGVGEVWSTLCELTLLFGGMDIAKGIKGGGVRPGSRGGEGVWLPDYTIHIMPDTQAG